MQIIKTKIAVWLHEVVQYVDQIGAIGPYIRSALGGATMRARTSCLRTLNFVCAKLGFWV